MGDLSPLAHLGDLTKAANTLIEKISGALGGIFKPFQIRRVTKAEAEADIIRANGQAESDIIRATAQREVDIIRATTQIEITALERRALTRFFAEEGKKEYNIESIMSKALPQVTEQARSDQVEDDWIVNFFGKCRLISDEEMQTLWARILAGEANSPGKYSKRTVNLLASLDKSDAEKFSRLCCFCIYIADDENGEFVPLVYETDDSIYIDHGINFMTIAHLESVGLIHFSSLPTYARRCLGQKVFLQYFENKMWIEFENPEVNEVKLGQVLFTQAGQQLAPICGAQPQPGFLEYVMEKWKSFGYKTRLEAEQHLKFM
jgi:hypothetical protein